MKYTIEDITTIGFRFKFNNSEYIVIPVPERYEESYGIDVRSGRKIWTKHADQPSGGYFDTIDVEAGLNMDNHHRFTPITEPKKLIHVLHVDDDMFIL